MRLMTIRTFRDHGWEGLTAPVRLILGSDEISVFYPAGVAPEPVQRIREKVVEHGPMKAPPVARTRVAAPPEDGPSGLDELSVAPEAPANEESGEWFTDSKGSPAPDRATAREAGPGSGALRQRALGRREAVARDAAYTKLRVKQGRLTARRKANAEAHERVRAGHLKG